MQTSSQSSGAEKALSGLKGRSKRKQGCVEVDQNGSKGEKKPIKKRKARTSGNAKPSKQRPACRIHWRHLPRHPELDFYGAAVRHFMDKLDWTERDLAAAAALCCSCVNDILRGTPTTDLERDRRLHEGLGLRYGRLHDLAAKLSQRASSAR